MCSSSGKIDATETTRRVILGVFFCRAQKLSIASDTNRCTSLRPTITAAAASAGSFCTVSVYAKHSLGLKARGALKAVAAAAANLRVLLLLSNEIN